MPGWTIKKWDMNSFDVSSVPFVAEAVAARKWAFACDFIRCYALYTEGGVYFDSDVLVRKPMDFVLSHRAFSAIETYPDLLAQIESSGLINEDGTKKNPEDRIHGLQIQAAILGSEKGHPFFRDCVEYYRSIHFHTGDSTPSEDEISPIVMACIAEKYGFRYLNKEQELEEDFYLYSSDLFCPQPYLMKPEAVAVHCCNGSWRRNDVFFQRVINNLKTIIKHCLNTLGLRSEKAIDKIR